MTCNVCVNHLDEKAINELGNDDGNMKIKNQYKKEKSILEPYLRKGEKCLFCVWNYLVVGSKSVCADIEIPDEADIDE